MAKASVRDSIIASLGNALKSEVVEVPEWGVQVMVRELSASEHDAYQAALVNVGKGGGYTVDLSNHRCELLVRALRDLDGKRLFQDREVSVLGQAPSPVIDRLYAIAQRVTGIEESGEVGNG